MGFKKLKGTWALVTGASGGLGADFARELATEGFSLILTARRQPELETLQVEILKKFPQQSIRLISGDLTQEAFRNHLEAQTRDLEVGILVNNAGFGAYGAYDALDWDKESRMIDLDIKALVHLTKLFSARMKAAGRGKILQVASLASYQPIPLFSSYAASKAFVQSYSLAVRAELEGTGVQITVLNPGVTATGFFDAADNTTLSWFQKASMMPSRTVARLGIRALARGRALFVPGWLNRFSAHMSRFLPKMWVARAAGSLMK